MIPSTILYDQNQRTKGQTAHVSQVAKLERPLEQMCEKGVDSLGVWLFASSMYLHYQEQGKKTLMDLAWQTIPSKRESCSNLHLKTKIEISEKKHDVGTCPERNKLTTSLGLTQADVSKVMIATTAWGRGEAFMSHEKFGS